MITSSEENAYLLCFHVTAPADLPAKVLLLIPHLGIGGSQRVVATLARHLDARRFEVHICLVTESDLSAHQFPVWVHVHVLSVQRARYAAMPLLRLIWTLRPQVVFAGMAHLGVLMLFLRPFLPRRTRIITRQNDSLSASLHSAESARIPRLLLASSYKTADAIVCQTRFTAQQLRREFSLPESRICVLANPVDAAQTSSSAEDDLNHLLQEPFLIAVGRLVPEKGFDLLLEAFAAASLKFPLLRLLIAGSGPSLASLEDKRAQLNLEHSVRFLGQVSRPSSYFSKAKAFVLSSRHDELPNALLEAAAYGLPIVATPASPGLADLLRNRPGVWMASESSAASLQVALRRALSTLSPSQRFRHEWIHPFTLKPAIEAYERLIGTVIHSG